ncbi:MAG: hemolysin III family protein [Myxococcota bacterium]|nr:hemolysin III family protein [Myxococcota bacterium]
MGVDAQAALAHFTLTSLCCAPTESPIGEVTVVALSPPIAKPPKPKLRGVSHLIGMVLALIAGPWLYLSASVEAGGLGIYAVCLVLLLGISGIYHTVMWTPEVRARLRRLDRSMIYVFVAGTYTPILLALGDAVSPVMMPAVWLASLVGIALVLFFTGLPRYVTVTPYLVLGWGGAVILPALLQVEGGAPFWWVLGGGVVYSMGAIIYARRSPNPAPSVFGYHEIFHLLVLAAAACHYVAIWDLVV